MRYMLLIYGSEADATTMTQEERDALMQGHAVFANEALTRGILTGGAPLQPTHTATTVRVRKGKIMITDGPFAETKEQLAGTYILNCKDLDEAIEMATRIDRGEMTEQQGQVETQKIYAAFKQLSGSATPRDNEDKPCRTIPFK